MLSAKVLVPPIPFTTVISSPVEAVLNNTSAPFASLGTGVGKSANETFAHARSLEAAGSINEARKYYHQALDLDALRFRADSKINTITRKIGEAGGKNVVFFDAQAELDVLAEAGVSGSDYFFEHVHLTFKGNYQLALLFAERISKKFSSLFW